MKVGVIPVNIDVDSIDQVVDLARLAESLKYESVWTQERVMAPLDYKSKYPYNASGRLGLPPETNCLDPLVALAAVAAVTTEIRIGTGVNILSQVNPLYLAKQAASLDFVSKGRFILGVGIGWLREDYEALGVPFERRGARFDDYLEAMRKVWSTEVVEHESEFLSWRGFKSHPLPVQTNFPVVIGGGRGKVFERTAKLGNGWYAPGWYATSDDLKLLESYIERLRNQCDQIGRDLSEIEITCMWPGRGGREFLGELAAVGVGRVLVPMMGVADPKEYIAQIAETAFD